jgi:chemotaxis protein MotA
VNASIVGVSAGSMIVAAVIFMAAPHAALSFANFPSALVVVGGTFCACFVALKGVDIKIGLKASFSVFKSKKVDYSKLLTEIIKFAEETRGERNAMNAQLDGIQNHFFRDGVQLILDRIPADRIDDILIERIECARREEEKAVQALKSLGKYPPAFGMIGTVIGLVGVLQTLGTPEGDATLGKSMAVGLITTLYGLLMSNMFFLPAAEKVQASIDLKIHQLEFCATGVMLLVSGENPVVIQESLNARIEVQYRTDVLGIREGTSQAA